jgi:hypothetical protein
MVAGGTGQAAGVSVLTHNGVEASEWLGLAQPTLYATESKPTTLALADFDGDHRPDVAVADAGSGAVSVLINSADGTMSEPKRYAAGGRPVTVVAANLDGIGGLDLAVLSQEPNNIWVLPGIGDGTFLTQVREDVDPAIGSPVQIPVGQSPVGLVSGDWNRDGLADLAVADSGSQRISVFFRNAEGAYGPAAQYDVGVQPVSLISSDLNGDDLLDLATSNWGESEDISVLYGNDDGSFQAATRLFAHAEPGVLGAGDINGDGIAELAVVEPRWNYASIVNATGPGSPALSTSHSMGTEPWGSALADLNRERTQRGQASLFWLWPLVDSCFGYDAGEITMPRPSRAEEAGGLDRALNRGHLCAAIFHKDEDFAPF